MGSLEGVVATRAAWLGALEVVEVRYRPAVLSLEALLAKASERACDQRVFVHTNAQLATARAKLGERAARYDEARHGALRVVAADEQLYYLNRAPLRYVPLTPVQARQVNAALGARVLGTEKAGTALEPEAFLSPRQSALASRIAAVLRTDSKALDGLARPDELAGLAAYGTKLENTLRARE